MNELMLDRVRDLVATGPRSAVGRQSTLQRVRWRFVLLNLVGAALAPLNLARMEEVSSMGRIGYLAAVVLLSGWCVAIYRTAGQARGLDPLGPLLVTLIGVSTGEAGWAFAPMYLTLFLHSLYGERGRVFRNAGLYVMAYQVAVVAGEGLAGMVDERLVSTILAAVVMAWVMHEMAASVRRNDTIRDREDVLVDASRGLLRASDRQQVAEVAARCVAELAAAADGPTPRAAVWWEEGESLRLAASWGPPIGIEAFDLSVLPSELAAAYRQSRPMRLGPEEMASSGRAAGTDDVLDHGLAVPLTDGEVALGMVSVQTGAALDDDVVAALQRFTHEVSLADRAARRNRMLAGVLENSADGIVLVDGHARLAFVSPAVVELAGRRVEVGEPLGGLLQVDAGGTGRPVQDVEELQHHEGSLAILRVDGRLVEVEVSARAVTDEGTVLNIRDVSERRRMQAEITHRAFYDPVTQLPNRALFFDRLDHALARAAREDTRLAVALLDLDDFKAVNDRWGHMAGDGLLRHVATSVSEQVRDIDTVARLSGDEFAVLIEGLDEAADLHGWLAKVLAAASRPLSVDGHEVSVTASGGLATSDGGHNAEEILGEADLAMYAAKEAGKNRAVVFHPDLRAEADDRRELRGDLEDGIPRGELRLHYQPVVSITDEEVVGVEALVRWEHPTRGLLAPDRFVPLAEDTGLVIPLGRWVLAHACRRLAGWIAEGLVDERFQIHVNLSVKQLTDDCLVSDVEAVLQRFRLDPAQLVLEVTETALADDPEVAERTLRGLHRLGIGIAIDDFGTGYASFTYLRRFPVDVVKIDRSFIADIAEGPEEASLAQAIVRLAGSLGMITVAEGVEEEGPRRLLAEWGCDHGQGWLWAKAMPEYDLMSWFARERVRTVASS